MLNHHLIYSLARAFYLFEELEDSFRVWIVFVEHYKSTPHGTSPDANVKVFEDACPAKVAHDLASGLSIFLQYIGQSLDVCERCGLSVKSEQYFEVVI